MTPPWHVVHRIDALPPMVPTPLRRYLCKICGPMAGEAAFTDGSHRLVEDPWTTNPGVAFLYDLYLKEH